MEQDQRRGEEQQATELAHHHARGDDARALVVAARQLRAPGRVRDGHHGPGEIEQERPGGEIERAGVSRRHEQEPDRRQHQRGAGRNPGFASEAPARQRLVRAVPDQLVGDTVENAHREQDGPDRGQRHAAFLGVQRGHDGGGRHDQDVQREIR